MYNQPYIDYISFDSGFSTIVEMVDNSENDLFKLHNEITSLGCRDVIFCGNTGGCVDFIQWIASRLLGELYNVSVVYDTTRCTLSIHPFPVVCSRLIVKAHLISIVKNESYFRSLHPQDIVILQPECDIKLLKKISGGMGCRILITTIGQVCRIDGLGISKLIIDKDLLIKNKLFRMGIYDSTIPNL